MYNVKRAMQKPDFRSPAFPPGLALIIGVLAASTSAVFVRYAQEEVPSIAIAALRLTFASLLLLPLLLSRHRLTFSKIKQTHLRNACWAGFFLAIHFASWIASLEYTNVASSVVIVQTNPLFVALLSPLLLREYLSPRVIIGMGIALVGSTIVGLSDLCTLQPQLACPGFRSSFTSGALKGDALALTGAIAGALYLIFGRRVRAQLELLPYISLVYSAAAIMLLLLMVLSGQSPFGFSLESYLWILLLALFPQLLAHSTYNWALGFLPAAVVSLSLLGEPVSAAILAYLFLGEAPTGLRVTGAALVLAGIGIAILHRGHASLETRGKQTQA